MPKANEQVDEHPFSCALDREKLRLAKRRKGRYLSFDPEALDGPRANMAAAAPETVWENYLLPARLKSTLPAQPPPRAQAGGTVGVVCRLLALQPRKHWRFDKATPRIAGSL